MLAQHQPDSARRVPDAAAPVRRKPAALGPLWSQFAVSVQRKCDACTEEVQVQRKEASGGAEVASPAALLAQVGEVTRAGGEPLDNSTRAYFEMRFARDFGDVRVHTGPAAAASARSLDAQAYTLGRDVVFAAGRYAPCSADGQRLLAHELTHVVQQSGTRPSMAAARSPTVGPDDSPLEREADAAADAVAAGRAPEVRGPASGAQLQRHKDDLVAYTGGQSGALVVLKAGTLAYRGPAVSGHPGHTEWEVNVGPTPTGTYTIHPKVTKATVAKKVTGAVCGAAAIASGYQEITSTEQTACVAGSAHYCNIPCPTAADPAQMCWTPRDCWGSERIRIEGSANVAKPGGGTQHRNGFYLHGGNPADPVSSGCIKSLDSTAFFAAARDLDGVKGAVPLCVGAACPPSVGTALVKAAAEDLFKAMKGVFL